MQDAVSLLLLGLIREGVVSTDARAPLSPTYNLVPVDYVVHAIVTIASRPDLRSRVFHLCARESISLMTLCMWLRSAGYLLDDVSPETFCSRMQKIEEDHPLFA